MAFRIDYLAGGSTIPVKRDKLNEKRRSPRATRATAATPTSTSWRFQQLATSKTERCIVWRAYVMRPARTLFRGARRSASTRA